MPAAKLNLPVEQGATFTKTLIWKDKNKRAVNLAGYSARMQIRKTVNDTAIIYELTTDNGRITFPAAGTIALRIPAEDTSTMQSGVYDLEMVAASGDVWRLVEGKVTVSPEVTR